MAVDLTTLTIITTVGSTGATVGAVMWQSIKALHNSTVKELKAQNAKLEHRAQECEEDRKELHGRLNDQSERITGISMQLGRLEGKSGKE